MGFRVPNSGTLKLKNVSWLLALISEFLRRKFET